MSSSSQASPIVIHASPSKRKSSQPLSLSSLGESIRETFLSSTATFRQQSQSGHQENRVNGRSSPSHSSLKSKIASDQHPSRLHHVLFPEKSDSHSSKVSAPSSSKEQRALVTNPFLKNCSPAKLTNDIQKRSSFDADVFDDEGSEYRRQIQGMLDSKPPGPMDTNDWRLHGKEMVDYIAEYLDTINKRRVTPNIEPGYLKSLLPDSAPFKPEKWENIMQDFEKHIMPGVTHWQHSRFHAYFPAGNSYPSILADMVTDAIGCIGFSWVSRKVTCHSF